MQKKAIQGMTKTGGDNAMTDQEKVAQAIENALMDQLAPPPPPRAVPKEGFEPSLARSLLWPCRLYTTSAIVSHTPLGAGSRNRTRLPPEELYSAPVLYQ